VIEQVKQVSAEDGKTVSTWIRDLVEGELIRRQSSTSQGWESRVVVHERRTPDLGLPISSSDDPVAVAG
jgi:hypothetical protein